MEGNLEVVVSRMWGRAIRFNPRYWKRSIFWFFDTE